MSKAYRADTLWVRGSDLTPELQQQCLAIFTARHTGQHVSLRMQRIAPEHRPPVHFDTDAEWLANTKFAMTKDGKRLNGNIRHCETTIPTKDRTKQEPHGGCPVCKQTVQLDRRPDGGYRIMAHAFADGSCPGQNRTDPEGAVVMQTVRYLTL